MRVTLLTALAAFCWSTPLFAQQEDAKVASPAVECFDLRSKANLPLAQGSSLLPRNNLAELPRGEQVLGGVRFIVGERYIQLSSPSHKTAGLEALGIPVNLTTSRLYFLHGTRNGADAPNFIEDGDGVGEYRVNYEDGSSAKILLIYGEDVRDWWAWGKKPDVTRGTIAWIGQSEMSREYKQKIYLYLMSWENPHPEKKILTLDFKSNGIGPAAPFCISISAAKLRSSGQHGSPFRRDEPVSRGPLRLQSTRL